MSARQSSPGVTLVPFLAVLVSAMGALILLLLVVTRQAQHQRARLAGQERVPAVLPPLPDLISTPAVPMLPEWEPPRAEPVDLPPLPEFTDGRPPLRNRHDELQAQLARLRDARPADPGGNSTVSEDLVARIESARRHIESLERERKRQQELAREQADEAERLKKEHADRLERSKMNRLAIVPYVGPNGTRRRPIYLECRDDTLTLQPEGIVIHADDLTRIADVNNPLSALLRSLAFEIQQAGNDAEPYPLFLVRPDGILLYYLAAQAISRTNQDIGYELIPADVDIEFPKADDRLRSIAQSAVDGARRNEPGGPGRGVAGLEPLRSGFGPAVGNPSLSPIASLVDRHRQGVREGSAPSTGNQVDSPSSSDGQSESAPKVGEPSNERGKSSTPRGDDPQSSPMETITVTQGEYGPVLTNIAERSSTTGASKSPSGARPTGAVEDADRADRPVGARIDGDASTSRPFEPSAQSPTRRRSGSEASSIRRRWSSLAQGVRGAGETGASAGADAPEGSADPETGTSTPSAGSPRDLLNQEPWMSRLAELQGPQSNEPESDGFSTDAELDAGGRGLHGLRFARNALVRPVLISCRRNELILQSTGAVVRIDGQHSIEAAAREVYQHVLQHAVKWGRPGTYHRYRPVARFLVSPSGLETYYKVRWSLLGTSLPVDHLLEDDGDSGLDSHPKSHKE